MLKWPLLDTQEVPHAFFANSQVFRGGDFWDRCMDVTWTFFAQTSWTTAPDSRIHVYVSLGVYKLKSSSKHWPTVEWMQLLCIHMSKPCSGRESQKVS